MQMPTRRHPEPVTDGKRFSMSWWSVPASPACTCCIGCAGSGFPRACLKPAAASAGPGTGTAIPGRVAISRAWNIPISFPMPCSRIGSGASVTPRSPKSCHMPSMWRTGSICAATLNSIRVFPAQPSMTKQIAGASQPRTGTGSTRGSLSWRPAVFPPRISRTYQGRKNSAAPRIIRVNGRTKASISPARRSRSSAPGHRGCNRSR